MSEKVKLNEPVIIKNYRFGLTTSSVLEALVEARGIVSNLIEDTHRLMKD